MADKSYRDDAWWREHFCGLAEEVWEGVAPVGGAGEDADFLESALAPEPGARLLDLPCGNGRVALELAARGYAVTGQDISAGLIARARRHAARRGVQVDWRVGDMREPPAGPPFDGIYCWGDSYGYFDEAGNRAFLDAVWQALRPGGRFALELKLVEEVLLPNFRSRLEGQAGDIRVRILRHYDARTRRLDSRYEYARGTQIELRHASYRIYSCQELCSLLATSGFAQARMLDGQGAVFRPGAEKLRLVATKPRD